GFRETRKVAQQLLAAIIEPRVTELFSMINEQITKSELKKTLGAGVVLTGGSSMLKGSRELAEQVFDLPVRVGTAIAVDGLTEVVNHPKFATGVGLLMYDEGYGFTRTRRSLSGTWLKQSFSQLRRAIASFI
ncbi:MAG: cell division protein FtsA, partial [bacterium]|nr:cell division protein FtsA [bacterium]